MKNIYSLFMFIFLIKSASFAQQFNQKQIFSPFPIGTTTYDLQTNASICNRMSFSNGKVVTTWNFSNSFSQTFPDRGTGYNFFDGTNWSVTPTSIIDSCAWPNIDIGGNVEYIVGHNRAPALGDLTLLKRSPVGIGSWQKSTIPPDPQGHSTLWPRMRVGGPNDSSIHVIALSKPTGNGGMLNNGIDGALTYSRSQDGGGTWDILHSLLPGINASNYASMAPETYAIDVRGSTIAIVQGSMHNDWVLWKSIDNGSSWFRKIIKPFPISAYNASTMTTDTNSDGVADTIETIDGSVAVLIDNNNMVHCWSGRMMVTQDTPGQTISYFPLTDGLIYWNESFLTDPPILIALMEDIDSDGVASAELGTAMYPMALTSMPSAGIDSNQGIFLAYASVVEHTDDGNGSNYRNVYVLHSNDNGTNWSTPFRLMPSDFDEQVYPSIPRNIDTILRVMYQQDGQPGISLNNSHPITNNDIIYFGDDTSQIFNGLTPNSSYYKIIKGKIFGDSNQNKIFDGNDFPMYNHTITLNPLNVTGSTDTSGEFSFLVPAGNYNVNYNVSSNWILTTDSSSYSLNITNSNITNLDFGIFPAVFTTSGSMNMNSSVPRCDATMTFWINVVNTGTVQMQGHLKFVNDPQISILNSVPSISSSTGDTAYWNLGSFFPSQSKTVTLTMSTAGLIAGTNIINFTSFSLDNTFANSQDSCMNQVIVCSFDPNDKSVNPEGIGNQHYTYISDSLFYNIRFQNTGTDTAFTVRILDTLNTFLDISTFEFVSSSHPMTYKLKPDRSIIYEFKNILLPDSNVNEPESKGFVRYKINPQIGIAEASTIENTAYIYFDYNPPVQTNTTLNTMVSTIGLYENEEYKFDIYPNPSNEFIYLRFENHENNKLLVEILDFTGKRISIVENLSRSPGIIHTEHLNAGVYFVKIMDRNKIISIRKLIKYNN